MVRKSLQNQVSFVDVLLDPQVVYPYTLGVCTFHSFNLYTGPYECHQYMSARNSLVRMGPLAPLVESLARGQETTQKCCVS